MFQEIPQSQENWDGWSPTKWRVHYAIINHVVTKERAEPQERTEKEAHNLLNRSGKCHLPGSGKGWGCGVYVGELGWVEHYTVLASSLIHPGVKVQRRQALFFLRSHSELAKLGPPKSLSQVPYSTRPTGSLLIKSLLACQCMIEESYIIPPRSLCYPLELKYHNINK